MPRGDIKWQRFKFRVPDGSPTNVDFTSIYFTVKRNAKETEYLFQKTLKKGEIYKLGPGDYQLKIEPEDTAGLALGDYKFDIQVRFKNLLKETFVGDFVLKEEITLLENEDDEQYEPDEPYISDSSEETVIVEIPDYHIITLETPVTAAVGSYNELSEKPKIADKTLQGNVSLNELGIQPAGNYPNSPLSNAELDILLGED